MIRSFFVKPARQSVVVKLAYNFSALAFILLITYKIYGQLKISFLPFNLSIMFTLVNRYTEMRITRPENKLWNFMIFKSTSLK